MTAPRSCPPRCDSVARTDVEIGQRVGDTIAKLPATQPQPPRLADLAALDPQALALLTTLGC